MAACMLKQGPISIERFHDAQGLVGDAFKCIAEKFAKQKWSNSWKSKIVCAYDADRGLLCVKHDHKNEYCECCLI